jgi:8-amino-7-oxononanoate synthase
VIAVPGMEVLCSMTEVPTTWVSWAESQLDEIRSARRWRATRSFDACGPSGILDGRSVVSFASNDYLGLSTHPAVRAAAHEAIDRWGTGSTASRLIVGSRPCHDELEAEIALWKRCERAVTFPTGFAANLGVLGVVGGPGVTVFSDELNHASIIDGCRLARSTIRVYRHGDAEHLDALASATSGPKVVVTDTVFSMDGDVAPLDKLADVCRRHDALLVLDEAHAVLGPDAPVGGRGLEVIRVGTLSKALGSLGGWVAGRSVFIDLIVNRARPFIFTTASSPADTAAALAALRIVRSDEGAALVSRLRTSIERVRPGHPSPIIPIVLGEEAWALKAAAALLDRGVLVPAIRPPTVPQGTSRLRIAVSAGHDEEMIDLLVESLGQLDLR